MSITDKYSLAQSIKSEALNAGFVACGLTPAVLLEKETNFLRHWLEDKNQGEMSYLERNMDKRSNPLLLAPYTKTVISLAYNYFLKDIPSDESYYKLARYSYLDDYHSLLKAKMQLMMKALQKQIGPFRYDCYADSAPVLEKVWAVKAGLGWVGKNSLLLIPHQGSYHFLAEIFTDLEPEYDAPCINDHCGNCSACIEACPTKAINSNRTINATKCITYHNIEKGKKVFDTNTPINRSGYIYGCDICQQACPQNISCKTNNDAAKHVHKGLIDMKKSDWDNLNEMEFKSSFKNTVLYRTGFNKIKANIECVRNAMPAIKPDA